MNVGGGEGGREEVWEVRGFCGRERCMYMYMYF